MQCVFCGVMADINTVNTDCVRNSGYSTTFKDVAFDRIPENIKGKSRHYFRKPDEITGRGNQVFTALKRFGNLESIFSTYDPSGSGYMSHADFYHVLHDTLKFDEHQVVNLIHVYED
jgi:hypothetical protein